MSQLTHINKSCHAYESVMSHISCTYGWVMSQNKWVMSHIWMSHVAHIMLHVWVSHVTHMNESCRTHHVARMSESCHRYGWVMSHISCRTYEWVMSHIWMSHVAHIMSHITSNTWMNHVAHCKRAREYGRNSSEITNSHVYKKSHNVWEFRYICTWNPIYVIGGI